MPEILQPDAFHAAGTIPTLHFVMKEILSVRKQCNGKGSKLNLQNTLLHVKSQRIFKKLLIWEKMSFLYISATQTVQDQPSEAAQVVVKGLENDKEMLELELQKSQVLLDTSKGISVKFPRLYMNRVGVEV